MNNIQNRNRNAINSENVFGLPSKNQISSFKPKLALNDRTNNHSALRDGAKMASSKITGHLKTTTKKVQKSSFVIAKDHDREADIHHCSKPKRHEPFNLDTAFECLMSLKAIVPKPEEKFEFESLNFDYDTVFALPEQPELDFYDTVPVLDDEPFELPPIDLPDFDCDFDF